VVCRNVFPKNLLFDIAGMSFEKFSVVSFSFPLEYVKAHYRGVAVKGGNLFTGCNVTN